MDKGREGERKEGGRRKGREKFLPHCCRYLTQREQWLLHRRQAAEAALLQQEELLEKEKELDKEEREIDAMINKALHGFGHSRQATLPSSSPLLLAARACTQTLLLFVVTYVQDMYHGLMLLYLVIDQELCIMS